MLNVGESAYSQLQMINEERDRDNERYRLPREQNAVCGILGKTYYSLPQHNNNMMRLLRISIIDSP